MDGRPSDTDDINGAINAVGIAFGSILVEKQGFNWTIATDEHGTDLAIRALPDKGDVVVFPANFVAKRWDRRERDFLVTGFEEISRYRKKLHAEWEDIRGKAKCRTKRPHPTAARGFLSAVRANLSIVIAPRASSAEVGETLRSAKHYASALGSSGLEMTLNSGDLRGLNP